MVLDKELTKALGMLAEAHPEHICPICHVCNFLHRSGRR
jgi:hypothetical protein